MLTRAVTFSILSTDTRGLYVSMPLPSSVPPPRFEPRALGPSSRVMCARAAFCCRSRALRTQVVTTRERRKAPTKPRLRPRVSPRLRPAVCAVCCALIAAEGLCASCNGGGFGGGFGGGEGEGGGGGGGGGDGGGSGARPGGWGGGFGGKGGAAGGGVGLKGWLGDGGGRGEVMSQSWLSKAHATLLQNESQWPSPCIA